MPAHTVACGWVPANAPPPPPENTPQPTAKFHHRPGKPLCLARPARRPVSESTPAAPDPQVDRGRLDAPSRGDGAALIAPSRWERTTSGVHDWTSGTAGSRSRAVAPSPTEVGSDIGRRWFGVLESLNGLVVRLMELHARTARGRKGGAACRLSGSRGGRCGCGSSCRRCSSTPTWA